DDAGAGPPRGGIPQKIVDGPGLPERVAVIPFVAKAQADDEGPHLFQRDLLLVFLEEHADVKAGPAGAGPDRLLTAADVVSQLRHLVRGEFKKHADIDKAIFAQCLAAHAA